jgi:hypothetical protein
MRNKGDEYMRFDIFSYIHNQMRVDMGLVQQPNFIKDVVPAGVPTLPQS